MTAQLILHSVGPSVSLQDLGRPGYRAQGLMRGGAADVVALHEAAALLSQSADLAAIEMVGLGGTFEATQDCVIALTGGQMDASLEGTPLMWNASHLLPAGAKLQIGGARQGTYGYLSVSGGFDVPRQMGARSRHIAGGIGQKLEAGQYLPLGSVGAAQAGMGLKPQERFAGGVLRIVSSMQTANFEPPVIERFTQTRFVRDARANRMGVRLAHDGDGFFASNSLGIVSEVIAIGDIQITGDGAPYVLMCECQTTGGYPRIGTVVPSDIPKVAQATTGAVLWFEFVGLEEAISIERAARSHLSNIRSRMYPLVRRPEDIPDLLGYQLVSGAISATSDPFQPQKGT